PTARRPRTSPARLAVGSGACPRRGAARASHHAGLDDPRPLSEHAVTATLSLRARVPGTITAAVEELDGRRVVLARSREGAHKGALDIVSGESLTIAAQTALRYRLPLVAVLSSSGADVH